MKVPIKLDNTVSEVEIEDSATIRQLKKQLSVLHGCKVSQCRLIHSARALRNDTLLSSLSVSATKPITLIIEEDLRAHDPRSDEAFLCAINELDLAKRLNNPTILELIVRLRTQLEELRLPEYSDAIRRLGLIPPYDPHRIEQLEESQYAGQLAHMEDMGFTDRSMCLMALKETGGNSDEAVEWLIENGKLS